MSIKLSPRLQCIADYVTREARVVDVGTDHGYIPIWLLQNGICSDVIATDIHQGPLNNAARDASISGVDSHLTFLLCDGLTLCDEEAVDTVIIAGMGGLTIMGILQAAPWAMDKHLIIQPQTKYFELRAFLNERGFCVRDASLVYDTGRIYRVWVIGSGSNTNGWIEKPLLDKKDPLLKPYLEDLIKRLRKQIQGLERASERDDGRISALHAELDEYDSVLKEALTWQQ